MMLLTFKIFRRAKNHGKKFLKLRQTSFSGIINCRQGNFVPRAARASPSEDFTARSDSDLGPSYLEYLDFDW